MAAQYVDIKPMYFLLFVVIFQQDFNSSTIMPSLILVSCGIRLTDLIMRWLWPFHW